MTLTTSLVASLLAFAGIAASLACCNHSQPDAPASPSPKPPTHDDLLGKPDLTIKDATKELSRSHVTPYLTLPHAPDESILWCATMQIAWDSLSRLMDSPFRLAGEPKPPMSIEMTRIPWKAGDLDDASFLAIAGYGPETVHTIKAELERKFHGAASPSLLPSPSSLLPDDILAYAYLFKNLQFEHPFARRGHAFAFTAAASSQAAPAMVQSFRLDGAIENWSAVAGQIIVQRYAAPDDFVIELRTTQPDDRLLVARLTPGATLKDTIDLAMSRANPAQPLPAVSRDEPFEMPLLNFDVTRRFEEIIGRRVATPGFTSYTVADAIQNIRLRLDERGAILKSEAKLELTRTAARPPATPRRFICDGPFLVIMARKDAAAPYFAAWIANDELLVKHR